VQSYANNLPFVGRVYQVGIKLTLANHLTEAVANPQAGVALPLPISDRGGSFVRLSGGLRAFCEQAKFVNRTDTRAAGLARRRGFVTAFCRSFQRFVVGSYCPDSGFHIPTPEIKSACPCLNAAASIDYMLV
jgi:hypothetical protein